MKKVLTTLLSLLLCISMLTGTLASCGSSDPELEDIVFAEAEDGAYSTTGEYTTVVYCEALDYSKIGKDKVSVKYVYGEKEYTAVVKEVKVIDQNTFELSFVNEKASEHEVYLYEIHIDEPESLAYMVVELPEANVTASVDHVYAYDNSFRITLELEEGTYAQDISEELITLGGSFEDFTIESLSASGKNLTMQLSGNIERNASAGIFVDGIIDIDETAFAENVQGVTVRIPVASEPVHFVSNSLKVNGTTVTAELAVNDSALLESLKAEDIVFENGVTVHSIAKGEGTVTLTMTVEGVDSANAAADILNRQTVTVGELEIVADFNAPIFYPVFDYVEENGANLDFTLILYATYGKFNALTKDMITLGGDFAGGSVASITQDGDYTAELIISVPAQGQSVEALDMDGSVSLGAGAMQSLWNTASEPVSHTRNYAQDSMGKDVFDDWFKEFATIDFDFTGTTVTSSGSSVKDYLHKVIDIFKGETFQTVIGVASGIGSAVGGIYTVLQVLGIVDSPLSRINYAIDLMQKEFAEINGKLDDIKKQNYLDKINAFYILLEDLDTYQSSFYNHIRDCGNRNGIAYPQLSSGTSHTEAELQAYNEALDAYYKQVIPMLSDDDMRFFNSFRDTYVEVTSYFPKVGESIFETFDAMMAFIYAFDSEAFEQRDDFRTLSMSKIMCSAGALGLFYKYYYSIPATASYQSDVLDPYNRVYAAYNANPIEETDDKIYCYVKGDYYSRQMVIPGIADIGYGYAVMNPSATEHPKEDSYKRDNVKANLTYKAQPLDTKIAVGGVIYTDFEVGDVFTGKTIKVKRGGVVYTYTFDSVTLATAKKGKDISKANVKEIVKRFKANYGSKMNMLTVLGNIGFVIPTDVKVNPGGKTYKRNISGIMYNVRSGTTVDYVKTNGKVVTKKDVYGYENSFYVATWTGIYLQYYKDSVILASFVGVD